MRSAFGRDLNYYVTENFWGDLYVKVLIHKGVHCLDSSGVPRVKYVLGNSVDYYNPSTTSLWGLHNLDKFLNRGKVECLSFVRNCVTWLRENAEKTDYDGFVWPYKMEWPAYGLRSGWVSAMAQGLGISLLLRGAVLFENSELLDLAEKSFIPMTMPVEEGGVAIIKPGFYWLEEIPSAKPSLVLNGSVFGLFGIYDLCRFTGKDSYREWFEKSIRTLVKTLPSYDLGTWSLYDLGLAAARSKTNALLSRMFPAGRMHNIATPSYNLLHINQLKKLYEVTGISVFKYYSRRWSLNPLNRAEFLTSFLAGVRASGYDVAK